MSFTDSSINPQFNLPVARRVSDDSARSARIVFDTQDNLVLAPTGPAHDYIAAEFEKHERKWKRDTQYTSSLSEKYLHASYARMIGLGWAAVPFILASLRLEPDDWFYALRAITGADPVRAQHAGNMTKMSEAWIMWGRQRGLC